MPSSDAYVLKRWSANRAIAGDLLWAAARQHTMHGLIEVDITWAREVFARRRRETGEAPSLTAWVAACVAEAAREHEEVRTLRVGRHLLVMKAVDVSLVVERLVGTERIPMPYVVRNADEKGLTGIHAELREAQATPVANAGSLSSIEWITALPAFLRRLMLRATGWSRAFAVKFKPPITVTSVGAVGGRGASWGIPLAPLTLSVTIGGIVERAVVVAGRAEMHEHLCLTLSLDHDIIDGAPAARFTARLRELLAQAPDLPPVETSPPAAATLPSPAVAQAPAPGLVSAPRANR